MTDTPLVFLWILLALAGYVWVAASLAAVFRKVGERAWQAWVPVLNMIVLLRLAGFSPWLLLLNLIPVLGTIAFVVIWVIASHRINASFGFGAGMTVLAAVLFPVWTSILGWGSARWLPAAAPSVSHPLRTGARPPVRPGAPTGSVASVFGTHGAAGGPSIPPRPPAPRTGGFPSVIPDAPAQLSSEQARMSVEPAAEQTMPPTAFRSTMRTAGAEADAAAFAPNSPYAQPYARRTPGSAAGVGMTHAGSDDDDATAPPTAPSAPPVSAAPPLPLRRVGNPWQSPVAEQTDDSEQSEYHDHHLYETSAEVSARAGAPTSGSPRAARTSVSAQHAQPEIPDENVFDETVVAARRRTKWTLIPPLGAPIPVTGTVLILGRRPNPDLELPLAQLIPISDDTRTISKTHARIELQGDAWVIIDLDSTNGVILIGADGDEVDAEPGTPEKLTERFLLGDAELKMLREGE